MNNVNQFDWTFSFFWLCREPLIAQYICSCDWLNSHRCFSWPVFSFLLWKRLHIARLSVDKMERWTHETLAKNVMSSCSSWEQTRSSCEQTGGLRITSRRSHIRSPNRLCCRQRYGSVNHESATPSLLILSRSAGYNFIVIIIAFE